MTGSLRFLGASGTVTGSKYLVEAGGKRLLIDAGMFQGERRWREENWRDPQLDLEHIDAVLITHAHIDHTGILPRYVAQGLTCPVYATSATVEMSQLLLLDAARLQEEEASYRLESGKSRHKPPLPLYREKDAQAALRLFRPVPLGKAVDLFPRVSATWRRTGHILGAASIELVVEGRRLTFSGDVGRYGVPIMRDPEPVDFGDLLLIESTYGDKLHSTESASDKLAQVINDTAKRGGLVLVPSFAVGRTQLLLYQLRDLKQRRKIPDIPVIIDSPMARDATTIYSQFPDEYDEEALGLLKRGEQPFMTTKLRFIQDRQESIQLNSIHQPMVLIAGSGMLSGGRILHHLKHRLPDPKNTLLFVGYQPKGGRGDWIKKGNQSATILGDEIPIRAQIDEISGLSAHADRQELLRWCRESTSKPGKVYVVHGEPGPASSFRDLLIKDRGWDVELAGYQKEVLF